jgi:hypothetical protein
LPGNLPKINETGELSIYKGSLTQVCIVESTKRLKDAFPGLSKGFFDVLTDRVKANEFCDQRLKDAIFHVIDTCIYPIPTIANVISFDKRVKIFTYKQLCELIDKGEKCENYKVIKFNKYPKPVWIHVNDIATYKIESEK